MRTYKVTRVTSDFDCTLVETPQPTAQFLGVSILISSATQMSTNQTSKIKTMLMQCPTLTAIMSVLFMLKQQQQQQHLKLQPTVESLVKSNFERRMVKDGQKRRDNSTRPQTPKHSLETKHGKTVRTHNPKQLKGPWWVDLFQKKMIIYYVYIYIVPANP